MEDTANDSRKEYEQVAPKIKFWETISPQWFIFFQVIAQPWVVVFIIISIISLVLSYFTKDKEFSLALNITACFLTSLVGGMCYDRYKQISGDTVLVKKGKGAVRSLFLIVEKVKNISLISKKRNNIDEMNNLLGLVEMDVLNSIQEWTDIIPSIASVEIYRKIIEEKETERDEIHNQYDELKKKLDIANEENADVKKLSDEVTKLRQLLKDREKEIFELNLARNIAITTSTGTSGILSVRPPAPTNLRILADELMNPSLQHTSQLKCPDCGKYYFGATGLSGKCNDCLKRK